MKRCLLAGVPLVNAGYGLHSRQILFALSQKFDTACQARGWGECSWIYNETAEKRFIISAIQKYQFWQQSRLTPDFSVQISVPNEFMNNMAPRNIGVTAGIETDRVKPEWILKCNEMNLVIVPSTFVKDTFEKTTYQSQDGGVLKLTTPIEVVPESADTSIFNETETADLDIDDMKTSFNFLTVGQWGIGDADRKNITLLIKTFKETFKEHRDKEKIGLVLRVNSIAGSLIDEDYTLKKIKSIINEYPEFPKIYLIHGFMSNEELARLYKDSRVKALISITHGEGYGLPLLEAAACNLPVIATAWSGHCDFLNKGKWIRLPYELKDIGFQNDLFQPGSRWAFVDIEETKRHMKKIYERWDVPKSWAIELGKKIREEYSIKKIEDQYFEVMKKYGFLNDEAENTIADSIFSNVNMEEVTCL